MSSDRQKLMEKRGVTVWLCHPKSSLFFISGLSVDADGAPNAYHPHGKQGLDYLGNAGKPGDWYGILTHNGTKKGRPVVQGARDPCPGYYVSPTSLTDPRYPRNSPLHYVDSTQVSYIALPSGILKYKHASLGDFAVVWNSRHDRLCPAIVADAGPRSRIGEGSIALAQRLALNSNPRNGGTEHGICYVVFAGSCQAPAWPLTNLQIEELAWMHFLAWGGRERILRYFDKHGHAGRKNKFSRHGSLS